jgi:hypothetical protein
MSGGATDLPPRALRLIPPSGGPPAGLSLRSSLSRSARFRVSIPFPLAGAEQASRPFSNTAGTAMLRFLSRSP